MRAYCEYRSSQGMVVNLAMSALETKYPELKYYHDTLGGDRIRALGYKEKALLNEVHTVKTPRVYAANCMGLSVSGTDC